MSLLTSIGLMDEDPEKTYEELCILIEEKDIEIQRLAKENKYINKVHKRSEFKINKYIKKRRKDIGTSEFHNEMFNTILDTLGKYGTYYAGDCLKATNSLLQANTIKKDVQNLIQNEIFYKLSSKQLKKLIKISAKRFKRAPGNLLGSSLTTILEEYSPKIGFKNLLLTINGHNYKGWRDFPKAIYRKFKKHFPDSDIEETSEEIAAGLKPYRESLGIYT